MTIAIKCVHGLFCIRISQHSDGQVVVMAMATRRRRHEIPTAIASSASYVCPCMYAACIQLLELDHGKLSDNSNIRFTSTTDSKVLVKFLEAITGQGSVYVCKVRAHRSSRSKMYARVQFEGHESAAKVFNIATLGRLVFSSAALKVHFLERDIISNPKSIPVRLERVKLHMGCQLSENVMYSLWSSTTEVVCEFVLNARKVSIYLHEPHIEYKMELSSRDIRYIHHRKQLNGNMLLLLQLVSVPKIYYKEDLCSSYDIDNILDFYRDSNETEWIRTTDSTRCSSIGQSSSICLELPDRTNISVIEENFAPFKELEERLSMVSGSSFSSSSKLVPTISPPEGLKLPFEILFQVNSLVQCGILSGLSLSKQFFSLLQPIQGRHLSSIKWGLAKLSSLRNTCYDPVKFLMEELNDNKNSKRYHNLAGFSLDSGLMYVHRVQVTPSKVYFFGPEINVSNHVTREYAEYIDDFLRVCFVDENWNRLHSTDLSQRLPNGQEIYTKLYKRILSVLNEGIVIGSKKFEFLAFSTSQLQEGSVWMFASNDRVSADSIRKWMGDFLAIKNVAKCAARMGQSFSSSTETLHVYEHDTLVIPDIYTVRDGKLYTFSDGIGKISVSLAKQVAASVDVITYPLHFK